MRRPFRLPHARLAHRGLLALVAMTLLASACGGRAEGSGADDGDGTPSTTADTAAGPDPGDEAPTQAIRHGEHWSDEVIANHTSQSLFGLRAQVVDGDLWLIGGGSEGARLIRRDGTGWAESSVGAGAVKAFASDGSGTVVGVGIRAQEAIVMLSQDGGTSWRAFQPPSMATPAGSEQYLEDVVHRPGEFLAVGTVRGPDWHTRLWSSPDGETWTLRSELRADGHPMSAGSVMADADLVVVSTAVHPCSVPYVDSSADGWYLGPTWLNELRVYQGADPSALAVVGEGDHPLVAAPLVLDCSTSMFELSRLPHARAVGAMVGDTPTMVERVDQDEEDRPQRVAQLVDGAWQLDQIPAEHSSRSWEIVDVDGQLALSYHSGLGAVSISLLVKDDDGAWSLVESAPQILNDVWDIVWHDGSFVVFANRFDTPFDLLIDRRLPYDVVVLRSFVDPGLVPRCAPAPGADCASVAAADIDGYPDLAGADLSGADLTGADLGIGSFDGASFVGATMVGVTAGGIVDHASFDGADLTDAVLHGADLAKIDGANFAGADLSWSKLTIVERAPVLDGADLGHAWLTTSPLATGSATSELVLSLAGTDLTSARIRGPLTGDSLMRIASLAGATLSSTNFSAVDLRGVEGLDGIDLGAASFDDRSICPDGDPPVSRSCLR